MSLSLPRCTSSLSLISRPAGWVGRLVELAYALMAKMSVSTNRLTFLLQATHIFHKINLINMYFTTIYSVCQQSYPHNNNNNIYIYIISEHRPCYNSRSSNNLSTPFPFRPVEHVHILCAHQTLVCMNDAIVYWMLYVSVWFHVWHVEQIAWVS